MNIGEPFLLSLTNSEWIVAPINNTLKSNLFIWTLKDDEVKPNDVSINKIEMPPFLPPQPIKNPNDYVQEYQIKTKEQNENKTGVFENKQMVEIRKEKLDVEYWIAAPLKTQPWLMSIRFPVIALDFYLQSYFSILKKSMIRDLLLLSLAIFLIIRLTTRDLRSLIKVIDNTKAGQLDTPLPKIRSQDEVGRLYLAFSKMRESLKLHIKQLHETTAAKERIESELAIAGQIQRSMVPKIDVTDSTNHCYKICAMLQPARQVGGDLYDYFLLGENKLCFVIGDVSDKGVPAALTMARVITLIRTLAKIEGSPASILIAVNETLSNGNEQCDFVTLFCAILEIDNGILEYASGGHDPPLLFRNKQTMWLELETGPAVGLFPDAEFPTHRMKLEPDDLLLLYTDGITEAMNLEGELFTSERLKSVLEQHPPTDPVRLIRSVQYFYRNFIQQAPASDDLTLLAIQHLPSNPFETKTKVTEWIITLNNELTELDRVRERLGEILFKQSLSLAFIEDMQLVAEEILVNIIEHGFYDTQGLQYIDIHLTLAENLLTLSFEDKAKPFNPLTEIPPPDLSIDAAQREAGGFGFFLVRNLVENINYANQDGKNILTISRAINSHH
jgi:sigma-B regulation protein RsbU (phosphoserine phosphatase)